MLVSVVILATFVVVSGGMGKNYYGLRLFLILLLAYVGASTLGAMVGGLVGVLFGEVVCFTLKHQEVQDSSPQTSDKKEELIRENPPTARGRKA